MKFLYTSLAALLLVLQCNAQNLVINGDFETYSTCPTTLSQTTNCTGWRSFTTGTSDYFNCGLVPIYAPFGYQLPASGNGYTGGYAFTSPSSLNNTYKELVAGLMNPMQIGVTYEVSLSVNKANFSTWGSGDLGVFFYKDGPNTYPGNTVPPVTPQVMFGGSPVIDTVNWIRLTAMFYADSAYENIVIGSWLQSFVANKTQTGTSSTSGNSYYYFDSVVVRIATKLSISYSDSLLCTGQSMTVPYTVNSPGYFQSGNTFTLQLSNATGSFASPVTLATQAGTQSGSFTVNVPNVTPGTGYRIRVVSSNPVDSSNISLRPIIIGNVLPAKPVITATNPCEGQTLNLAATNTTTGVNYKWRGPNSFTSTVQNPVINNVTAAATGNYIVTTWLYGCSASDTESVNISPTPAAITASSNAPLCEGQTLNLGSTNSTTGVTYSWTGPNSFTSNQQNPSISNTPAAADGDYIVTANLNGCTSKDTVTAQVKPLPANFSATSNSPVCSSKPLNLFGNTTTAGVTFSWTGPGAFNTATQNPTIANSIPANSGDYILTATLNGCTIKDTATVIVNQSPAAFVIAGANTPVCQNTTLNLSATGAMAGSVYNWTGPSSFTSSLQNPDVNTIPLTAAGDYIVSISLNGCIEKDTVTVAVLAAPTNVNATSNSPICDGQTLNLNVTNNTPGVSFSWSGPSFSSSAQTPSITNATTAATGDYIATLSINGCVVKDTVSAIVHPMPGTPTASSNTPVCNGNTLNLFSGSSLAGATYNWTGPSSFSSAQQNPVVNNVNPGMSGTYYVSATLNGCTSATASTNVTILYFPSSVSAYLLPNDTICTGGSIQFIALASNGGANPQYRWLKNGFIIPGANSISYTTSNLVTGDKFSVEMTPDNTCPEPDTSSPIEITVLPWVTPSVSITATPNGPISPWQNVTFKATPVNGGKSPTYQWKRNGQNVVGAVNEIWGAYTLSDNDEISVVMYSNDYCPSPDSAVSNKITINVKLGISDVQVNDNWTVYPNPNKGTFRVTGNTTAGTVTLTVANAIGQEVQTETTQVHGGKLDAQVQLSNQLSNGIYLLHIHAGSEIVPLKIALQR